MGDSKTVGDYSRFWIAEHLLANHIKPRGVALRVVSDFFEDLFSGGQWGPVPCSFGRG